MNLFFRIPCVCAALAALATAPGLRAQAPHLDEIGVAALRAAAAGLDGSGIQVIQAEAFNNGTTNWQVNPSSPRVSQPVSRFTFVSSLGTATNFPNALCGESAHATDVARLFYGFNDGVATNVAHVHNFEAEYFIADRVAGGLAPPPAPVANQSYTFGPQPAPDQRAIDRMFDDYAVSNGILFVSGACNASISARVCAPGTGYNCISVGAATNRVLSDSSIGPTLDNARCKPDIVAPAGATSYSTPQVSGAAALLLQAAHRGDGGPDTNAASDLRVVKALLLNGAVKPGDWTNSPVYPLDARYGAGVLNVLNSWRQLAGGRRLPGATSRVAAGAPAPPSAATNTVPAGQAWDLASISSGETEDAVDHYLFDLPGGMATVTLVWNRPPGLTNAQPINDLDLYLYRAGEAAPVARSVSYVNNVEHLWVAALPAGRYDLQVVKCGGAGVVSHEETYAVAWEFIPPPVLSIAGPGPGLSLAWPPYPAGFQLEARADPSPGSWQTNGLPAPSLTAGGTNRVDLDASGPARFFRLAR